MPDCELLGTCLFFNDSMYEMVGRLKEQYCGREYAWCGRYMTFKMLGGELARRGGNTPRQERMFHISGSNKGLLCPFKPTLCQEGYCQSCQIYLDWQKLGGTGLQFHR